MSPLLLSLLALASAQETDAEPPPGAPEQPQADAPASETRPVRGVLVPGKERHTRIRRRARRGKPRQQVLRPWGQLQVFTTLWDQDEQVNADPASYGDPEADPGFSVARGRFGFVGELPKRDPKRGTVDYGLSLGIATPYDSLILGDSGVAMVDAFGRYSANSKIGPSSVSLGLLKVPFSREALMSSQDLLFQERAVGPEYLTSIRDVGALASQAFVAGRGPDPLQVILRAGVFNGNASFLGDTDPGLQAAVRLELAKGETYKTWNPDGGTVFGLAGSVLSNDELATRTLAWNTDALLILGPWSLMGEVGRATLTPTDITVAEPAVRSRTTRESWLVATSIFVPIEGVQGVEIGGRVSTFDDNARLQDNGDVLIVHAGAIWRDALPFLDIGGGYIHREELGGVDLSNDTIRLWTQIRPQ